MRIDICIPAYNEEEVIEEAVREVRRALESIPGAEGRVIVADNGSDDGTAARARRVQGVAILSTSVRGKGAAVVGAAKNSDSDLFGYIDADLSADPADIPKLVRAVLSGECDIAIGSRLLDSRLTKRERLRTYSSILFNAVRRMILGLSVHDTQCGLKIMNARGRAALAACEEKGWFFDMELLALAERAGLRIREIPIRWDEHRFINRESKLRLVRDGFGFLIALLRIARRVKRGDGRGRTSRVI